MQPCFHHRIRRRRSAGYALVMLVLFMMIFLSIAGLVIGLGFARLSQQQMQAATDAAALEGLRFRDEMPASIADQFGIDPNDAAQRDDARRQLAVEMAQRILSDPNGEGRNFGAGPVLAFENGAGSVPLTGDFTASQTLSIGDPPTYQPALQTNLANEPHGDMVAGSYISNGSFASSESRNETADYQRRDFVTDAGDDDAFLVRMRRTNGDADALDSVNGVSSRGPEVPLLFGRWLTFKSGFTVRSTSVAAVGETNVSGFSYSLGRAKSVGLADVESGTSGLAPFVLDRSFWDAADNWTIDPGLGVATAEVTIEDDELRIDGNPVGRFFDPAADRLLTIGETPSSLGTSGDNSAQSVYAPVVESIANPTVIGFGLVRLNGSQLERPTEGDELRSQVASGNASAVAAEPIPGDLQNVLSAHGRLTTPLLVPVLVNRHIGPN